MFLSPDRHQMLPKVQKTMPLLFTNHARNYSWNNQLTEMFYPKYSLVHSFFFYCSKTRALGQRLLPNKIKDIFVLYRMIQTNCSFFMYKKATCKVKCLQGYYNLVIYRAAKKTKLCNNNIVIWGYDLTYYKKYRLWEWKAKYYGYNLFYSIRSRFYVNYFEKSEHIVLNMWKTYLALI